MVLDLEECDHAGLLLPLHAGRAPGAGADHRHTRTRHCRHKVMDGCCPFNPIGYNIVIVRFLTSLHLPFGGISGRKFVQISGRTLVWSDPYYCWALIRVCQC